MWSWARDQSGESEHPSQFERAERSELENRFDQMSDPTVVQTQKFNEFLLHPQASQIRALLKSAIGAAGLLEVDRGIYWGVTVCPDKDAIARLNVSNRVLLNVLRDQSVEVFLLDEKMRFTRSLRNQTLYEGFTSLKGSAMLVFASYEVATEAFKNRAIQRYFRNHSRADWRRLPNSKWHNPLTNSLLL